MSDSRKVLQFNYVRKRPNKKPPLKKREKNIHNSLDRLVTLTNRTVMEKRLLNVSQEIWFKVGFIPDLLMHHDKERTGVDIAVILRCLIIDQNGSYKDFISKLYEKSNEMAERIIRAMIGNFPEVVEEAISCFRALSAKGYIN
ncbi:MAG: hypothetical protein V1829_00130 [bacterium]